MSSISLQPAEQLVSELRVLFDRYGYSRYKMNKFEEYDLYAKNKDFLVSDSVITFTDTNGKLMALKPDVTLSIVKNTKDDQTAVQKLYYNENVYRVSKRTHAFRELTQVGLEAIGQVDDYTIFEVLELAAKSLLCTRRNCVLEISHLGILSEVMDYAGVPQSEKAAVLHSIGEKNTHELTALCKDNGVAEEKIALLREIVALSGKPDTILPRLQTLLDGIVSKATLENFAGIIAALQDTNCKNMLRIDFSVVSDIHYYNGFVFRGFAEGVPSSVLSGGQYDTLMAKMKRKACAIGFAVYLDALEQYSEQDTGCVDDLIVYGDASLAQVRRQVEKSTADGRSVMVQQELPEGIPCKRLIKIQNGEAEIIENA